MNTQEFLATRLELPDGGRWHELHDGMPTLMEPPDDCHGNAVLNLSRALADWFEAQPEREIGYACHQVGLHVKSEPDTVLFPAMSFFDSGRQFEQSDNEVATAVPTLVVDVASANDRRSDMRRRTLAYAELGVPTIWVPDPFKKEVKVIHRSGTTLSLGDWQTLEGGSALPQFGIKVGEIFKQPDWWK